MASNMNKSGDTASGMLKKRKRTDHNGEISAGSKRVRENAVDQKTGGADEKHSEKVATTATAKRGKVDLGEGMAGFSRILRSGLKTTLKKNANKVVSSIEKNLCKFSTCLTDKAKEGIKSFCSGTTSLVSELTKSHHNQIVTDIPGGVEIRQDAVNFGEASSAGKGKLVKLQDNGPKEMALKPGEHRSFVPNWKFSREERGKSIDTGTERDRKASLKVVGKDNVIILQGPLIRVYDEEETWELNLKKPLVEIKSGEEFDIEESSSSAKGKLQDVEEEVTKENDPNPMENNVSVPKMRLSRKEKEKSVATNMKKKIRKVSVKVVGSKSKKKGSVKLKTEHETRHIPVSDASSDEIIATCESKKAGDETNVKRKKRHVRKMQHFVKFRRFSKN